MTYGGKDRACEGRHRSLDVYQMLELNGAMGRSNRTATASCSARSSPIRSPGFAIAEHTRTITEKNGRDSLAWRARPTAWPGS